VLNFLLVIPIMKINLKRFHAHRGCNMSAWLRRTQHQPSISHNGNPHTLLRHDLWPMRHLWGIPVSYHASLPNRAQVCGGQPHAILCICCVQRWCTYATQRRQLTSHQYNQHVPPMAACCGVNTINHPCLSLANNRSTDNHPDIPYASNLFTATASTRPAGRHWPAPK
jgi:hypothetical protein